jgi:hypothetical protein
VTVPSAVNLAATRHRVVVGATILLGLAGIVWAGSARYGAAFVRAVYAGDLLPYLGRLLRIHQANNPAHQDLSFYIELVEGAGRRLFVLTALFWGIVVLFVRWRPSVLRAYFSESSSPLSLAVFRIVVFGLLLDAVDVPAIVESARQASEVRYAPALMGWFFNHVPLGEAWVRGAARLMQGACLFALVGAATRPAAWIAGGLGIYVLGIPELLGKINHGRHLLVWFALLLGAAPSGDALSVDALVRAWRHPDDAARPPASARYGRPLRWAWLLIAIIYFFPGFWKVMLSGADWMLSENLKFKMYAKWHQLQWVPSLRIDRLPVLYQGLAVFTVGFELFFGVALLVRRLRPLAVLSGFGFHLGVAYFMRIVFSALMWCYVVFVPWGALLRRVGRLLFPAVLTVRFPETAPMLRRLMAVVRAGDWLRRVRYREHPAPQGIEAERDGTVWTGGAAFGLLLVRVPLLWPVAPFLALGVWLSAPAGGQESAETARSRRHTRWSVTVTGGALLGINVVFGLFLINSWPFSVYPTHAGVSGRYITDIDLDLHTATGDTLDAEPVLGLSASRRRGLMRQVLSAPDAAARKQEGRQLAQLLAARVPDSIAAETVYVYRVTISKAPDDWAANPVDRSLLFTLPLDVSSTIERREERSSPTEGRGRSDPTDEPLPE